MACQNCKSDRIMSVFGHCQDRCIIEIGGVSPFPLGNYVPKGLNVGGGDEIQMNICLDCGHVQGKWPLTIPEKIQQKLDEANASQNRLSK